MTRPLWFLVAACAAIGCHGTHDNSADTDQPSHALRTSQSDVTAGSNALATNETSIEHTKRAIVRDQQALTDQQALAERQRQQLGSAQASLQDARAIYAAAVKERLAKLDAALAALGTKPDARSRDALVGLRARRDQLSTQLAAMAGTVAPSWNEYTKDVDTTFDAIEHDLGDAPR